MKTKYFSERRSLLKYLKGKILDIGCNKGNFHKLAMEKGKEVNGEVYGLDIEVTNYKENMLKGDAHFLPFKDESFDSVFAGEIIEHLTNPAQFLKEIERILKAGGNLCCNNAQPLFLNFALSKKECSENL